MKTTTTITIPWSVIAPIAAIFAMILIGIAAL